MANRGKGFQYYYLEAKNYYGFYEMITQKIEEWVIITAGFIITSVVFIYWKFVMKILWFFFLFGAMLAQSVIAQESPEACNARAAIIKQQNQTNKVQKEVPTCPAATTILSSGTSSMDGKVIGGYTTYSNGKTVRTMNGVTKEVCTNGGTSCN
jgi:hypothetical protein